MGDWIDSLPPAAGEAREVAILDAVRRGVATYAWCTITSGIGGHALEVDVMEDALRVDDVRVNVSAATGQRIADLLDAVMLTPKLADLIFAQAKVVVAPSPVAISSTTAAMVRHSRRVDAEVAGRPGLVSTVGKDWVLVNGIAGRADKAANYGWHFRGSSFQGIHGEASVSLAGVRVIQGVGTAHNAQHVDYSQVVRLAKRACTVDSTPHDLTDVMRDAKLATLVSHEGPLRLVRQPGVDGPTPTPAPGPSPESRPVLRLGSRGPAVIRWQTLIGVDADGAFGPKTTSATRAWQTAHGLVPDGVVGPATWARALDR